MARDLGGLLGGVERRLAVLPAEELAARERPRCALPPGQHCSSGWHWRQDGGQGTAFSRCGRATAARAEAAAAEIPGGQTFESFERLRENDAYLAARRWADAESVGGEGGMGGVGRRTLALLRPETVAETTGCGKTHLLRAAARALVRTGRWVEYVTAPDLTRTVRGRALFDGAERGAAEIAVRKWHRCDALILDDLGQEETAAPITAAFVVGLLDEREGERLAFATNASERELALRFGVPLVSRLLGGADVPSLRGTDYRRLYREAV
ncbi:MAG: ATP-binding protein [Acidobacteriota bacterium]